MHHREITLDDLPRYSSWPALALGEENFQAKLKTPVEITREFNDEKWKEVQDWLDKDPALTYREINARRFQSIKKSPFFQNGRFYMMSPFEALDRHLALCGESMADICKSASALVELGAGYGSTILGIAESQTLPPNLPLYAAEYSAVGVSLIKKLALASGLDIVVGKCDFFSSEIDKLDIPVNSVIFTSYASHYVPLLTEKFIELFARLKPAAVFHFEPCYEHQSQDTLHGLLCRRYIQMNDYNRNLVSLLHSQRERGKIDIFMEKKSSIGSNPLLPISVIGWKPIL
jgi:hypothetical protein